jgi:hypothetical protein
MKNSISFTTCFLYFIFFISCKKDKVPLSNNTIDIPPVVMISCNATEYDFNITLIEKYVFTDNYHGDPWNDPGDYDITTIIGNINLPPIGALNISIHEISDTAALSDSIIRNDFYIKQNDKTHVIGNFSIHFKKLISQGGGPFSGTFNILYSSGQCYKNGAANLPPLVVTGYLDITSGIVELNFKGKIYLL